MRLQYNDVVMWVTMGYSNALIYCIYVYIITYDEQNSDFELHNFIKYYLNTQWDMELFVGLTWMLNWI